MTATNFHKTVCLQDAEPNDQAAEAVWPSLTQKDPSSKPHPILINGRPLRRLLSRGTESIGNFMVDAEAPLHLLYRLDKLYGRQSALKLAMDQVPRRKTATWRQAGNTIVRYVHGPRSPNGPCAESTFVPQETLEPLVHDPETRLDFDITTFPDPCRPSPFNSIPAS
ncbi:hypothetical protein BN1708_015716 [Verticillium longisporum]|uniref:Uncharacterized protein n=1 Tax=Verticillium longisporum TaxID=100787 RepID=A0A0G4M723_VERLO|nr:hypothetical protein BN1708_015716 [Verticillium longisporum]